MAAAEQRGAYERAIWLDSLRAERSIHLRLGREHMQELFGPAKKKCRASPTKKRRKEEGVCVVCGLEPPGPRSGRMCEGCREADLDYRRRSRVHAKQNGLCVRCKQPRGGRGTAHCQACLDRQNSTVRTRDSYRRRGLCTLCGGEPAPGMRRCRQCNERNTEWQRAYRRERRAKSECIRCGAKTGGRLLCAACAAKKAAAKPKPPPPPPSPPPLRAKRLCIDCMVRGRERGRQRCGQCLEKLARRNRRKSAERRAAC